MRRVPLLAALAAAPAFAQDPGGEGALELSNAARRIVQALRDTRSKPTPSVEETYGILVAELGTALPEVVEILVAGRLPGLGEEESFQTLSVPQRDR